MELPKGCNTAAPQSGALIALSFLPIEPTPDPATPRQQRSMRPELIRYWLTVGEQIILLLACSVVAIFGWFHPDS